MASTRPRDRPPLPEPPRCRHLLTSAAFGRPAEQPAGVGPEVFWCAQTSRSRGPDGLFVHPSECTEARTCYAPPAGPDEPDEATQPC